MAEHTRRRVTRRELLLSLAPASAALLATGAVHAQAPLPHLEEGDPAAKALGYVHDVARVDPKANPTFKAGSNCANCLQLQGNPGDTWRPCTIFPGKLVNANGWCKVWVPKS
jgi:hypothetical protein